MGPEETQFASGTVGLQQDSEDGRWRTFTAGLRLGKTFLVRFGNEHGQMSVEKQALAQTPGPR